MRRCDSAISLLVAGTFLTVVAEQMLGVAVGWELYERTRSPLALIWPEVRRLGQLEGAADGG